MRFFNKIQIPIQERSSALEELRSRVVNLTKDGNYCIFLTISPNPKSRHPVVRDLKGKQKTLQMAYKMMTHDEQHAYLQRFIKTVYIDNLDPGDFLFYAFETNSDNNLHLHGFLYSKDLQTEYELKSLQKTVYSHPMTIYNLAKPKPGRTPTDYMNNMFYIKNDDPTKDVYQKLEYIQKETEIKCYFPDCHYGL